MIVEQVARFIAAPVAEAFPALARAAFAFAYEHIEPYRALCAGRGVTPDSVGEAADAWQRMPMVPTAAFRTLRLAAAPAEEVFRSSGTSGGEASRSVHHHPFPDLYRLVIEATFPAACLPPGVARPAMLSLIPSREQMPDSSLSFMVDHALHRFGGEASLVAFGPRGVDFVPARSWLSARQRGGQPALVLATALALDQLLERLEKIDLRLRLPAGSVLFETGGFKGRRQEVSRDELLRRLEERLTVPRQQVVREYGMTELTSHFYSRALAGGDVDLFVPPPWVRVRVLDPLSLAPAAAGETGLLAIFDLANLGSAPHLLTEDLGVAEGDGFRLLGRAAGAQLRGCSLVVDELGG